MSSRFSIIYFIPIMLGIAVCVCIFSGLGNGRRAHDTVSDYDDMHISNESVVIDGIENEYKIFFVSDSHISLCDEADAGLMDKARLRQQGFVDEDGIESPVTFDKMVNAANLLETDLFIMGGDIIDSAMYASIDYLESELSRLDMPYMYELGNHDFEYGDEYFSEKAYSDYFTRLEALHGDEHYLVREFDDLIFFAVDDHNNRIDAESFDMYKELIKKNKPIILILHVPIEPPVSDGELIEMSKEEWGEMENGNSKVVIGKNGCETDMITNEFIDMVLAPDSPVGLVLGGHVHFYHKDVLGGNLVQIVSGAGFKKNALCVTIKPGQ